MEDKKSVDRHSLICTGNHLNQRVFLPEDPWLSIESTILSGNVTFNQESKQNELSTVDEEKDQTSIEVEPIEDNNVLNMNIDAISDEEVFFDCATSPCRQLEKFFDSLDDNKLQRRKIERSNTPRFGQFLAVEDCLAASSFEATETSSSVNPDQRTGALLVQIIDDFKDMEHHAQSTPKPGEKDSGYFPMPATSESSESTSRSKIPAKLRPPVSPKKSSPGRRLPTYRPPKKNGSPGSRSPIHKSLAPIIDDPSIKENVRPRRVKLMKNFFESRILSESQASQKSVKARASAIHCKETIGKIKTPPKFAVSPGSSIHCRETTGKVKRSPKSAMASVSSSQCADSSSIYNKTTMRKSTKMSSGEGTSQKRRSSRASRPSSCSDISTTESSVSRASTNRTKSTSDANSDIGNDKFKAQRFKYVTVRRDNFAIKHHATLHVHSFKDSSIKQRKSLGKVTTPIMPVREIRKKFSPSFQENQIDDTKNKPKRKIPCILLTNEE